MEKYNIKKLQSALKKKCKETGTNGDASSYLIINNMTIYNKLLDEFNSGKTNKDYLMYQLSSTIFKQLDSFGLVPVKQKEKEKDNESVLINVINKVQQTNKK